MAYYPSILSFRHANKASIKPQNIHSHQLCLRNTIDEANDALALEYSRGRPVLSNWQYVLLDQRIDVRQFTATTFKKLHAYIDCHGKVYLVVVFSVPLL